MFYMINKNKFDELILIEYNNYKSNLIGGNVFLFILFTSVLIYNPSVISIGLITLAIIIVYNLYKELAYRVIFTYDEFLIFNFIYGENVHIKFSDIDRIKMHNGWGGTDSNWIRFYFKNSNKMDIKFISSNDEFKEFKLFFINKNLVILEY